MNQTKMIVLHLRQRLNPFLKMGKSCPRSLLRPRKVLQKGHGRKNPVTHPDRHPKVLDQAVLENPSNTRMILLLKVLRTMILSEVNQRRRKRIRKRKKRKSINVKFISRMMTSDPLRSNGKNPGTTPFSALLTFHQQVKIIFGNITVQLEWRIFGHSSILTFCRILRRVRREV